MLKHNLLVAPLCWLAVGALVGVCQAGEIGPGLVPLAASVLAGMIVLTVVGLPIVLAGGRGADALSGAAIGLVIGLGHAVLAGEPVSPALPVITGALAASTGWPLVRNGVLLGRSCFSITFEYFRKCYAEA